MKPDTGYYTFNGVELYLESANLEEINWEEVKNVPAKIPFVIQHGHTAHHFFVKPIYDYFKKLGWPVVMFDWRGHGWSQKGLSGQYTLQNCVDDLYAVYTEFLKKQYGYEQFYLLGHSMGGFISLIYTTQHQETVKKLLPVSTSAKMDYFMLKIGMAVMIRLFRKKYEKMFNKKRKAHEELGLEFFPQWTTNPELKPDPDATIEFLEEIKKYNIIPKLHEIKSPTYVIVGGKDSMAKMAPIIANHIQNTKLEIIPRYEHNIPVQARDILPAKIQDFLENHTE